MTRNQPKSPYLVRTQKTMQLPVIVYKYELNQRLIRESRRGS